jgi:methionine sulfoxide reductase heme-binding subunit
MTTRFMVSTPTIVALSALATAGIAATGYAFQGGWTLDGALAGSRLTARFSFFWFIAAWSASALAFLFPGGWRAVLLRRRRAVGLGFATAHFVHLAALLAAIFIFGDTSSITTIIGGGFGYVLIAAMALTSNNAAVRALGPRVWKLLHGTGGYVIAGIFAFSYYGRLETKPLLAFVTLGLIAAAATLRIAAWLVKQRKAQLQNASTRT